MDVDGHNAHQLKEGVDGSVEGACHVVDGFVLGCAERAGEAGVGCLTALFRRATSERATECC